VKDRAGVAGVVLDHLVAVCAGRVHADGLADDTRLGRDGLGLDSIEIVELLLACEERYGTSVEPLLDGGPLTFGRVVDHFVIR
jgi:acyl carrier protein